MRTFQVIVLPRAESDIEANAHWWAVNHSLEQAVHWFDVIHEQLKSLAQFPESYGVSAENDEFAYEIRDKLVGLGSRPSYRAVFTIRDNTVYVLTVRRSSRDVIRQGDIVMPPSA